MIKTIAALGLFLLTTLGASASSLQEIRTASHVLHSAGLGNCSGQFISPNEFLTAAHCVEGHTDFELIFDRKDADGNLMSQEVVYLDVIKRDKEGDMAILKTRDPNRAFKFVDTAELGPALGETLYLASFPEIDWGFFWTSGMYNGTLNVPFEVDPSYSVGVDTAPGSSGGGLYRKIGDEYYLVGTVQGGPHQHDYMSFFATLVTLNGLLAR